ncbi:MAG: tRNA dimethylallyltransferase [Hyphomicrobiales bacterium]|nr:tRNA dimethylallyltransferase [Hyphomicrobiales bacterium]
MRQKRAILIAGPTASGKSALGLKHAREQNGVIINTDAMQVYSVLDGLTARPPADDLAQAPHRLYGVIKPGERFSTGGWLTAVKPLLDEAAAAEQVPIFVGGTGLYFDALINGFAEVPVVPPEIAAEVQREVDGLDAAARGALIAARDPAIAARLKAPDPQRVARALAVLAATGRSLASFQDDVQAGLLGEFELERIVLNPDRTVLAERIARRFATMLESGAVEEVEALRALGLDPMLPAMKAIGVREISDWLDGRISREQAIELAVIATRQYAKRQRTWFRNRMGAWTWIDPPAA